MRASPKMKANLQKLVAERDRLMAEMEALKNKIAGFELAIGLLENEGGASAQSSADPGKRGQAKALLLDLLREVGTTGLNASTAVEIAARRGIKLERGTAASNLSRLKKDGVVNHDGDKYKLPEFSRPALALHVGGKDS